MGFYRRYFHIGRIGFKFARVNHQNGNPIIGYIISCIMNQLEWKRYRYYCKGRKFKQWGHYWRYKGEKPIFCPVYFSCGIFSIVNHIPNPVTEGELQQEAEKHIKTKQNAIEKLDTYICRKTVWLVNDIKAENFRRDKDGILYCIDYGEFTCSNLYRQSAVLIDYE